MFGLSVCNDSIDTKMSNVSNTLLLLHGKTLNKLGAASHYVDFIYSWVTVFLICLVKPS